MDNNIRTSTELAISHHNLRSIRNKFLIVKREYSKLNNDIISFSETWLQEHDKDNMYILPNYTLYRQDREDMEKDGGGGLCTYVRTGLTCSSSKFEHLNVSNKFIEMQWIFFRRNKERKCILVNIYRPPEGDVNDFIARLKAALLQVKFLNTYNVYVTGDFNIDMLSDSTHKDNLIEMMGEFNLNQLVKSSTKSHANGKCIDLMFSNNDNVDKVKTLTFNCKSDHRPIFLHATGKKKQKEKKQITGRSFKNFNPAHFIKYLNDQDWLYYNNLATASQCWDWWVKILTKYLDINCPVSTFTIREHSEEWMNPELHQRLIEKERLYKKGC